MCMLAVSTRRRSVYRYYVDSLPNITLVFNSLSFILPIIDLINSDHVKLACHLFVWEWHRADQIAMDFSFPYERKLLMKS